VVVRSRSRPLLAAYVLMLVGHWIVGGHGFDVLVGLTILLTALELSARPELLLAQRWVVLAAGVVLATSAWFRDVTGIRAGLVLVALLAVGIVAAFAPRDLPAAVVAAAVAAPLALIGHPFVGAAAAVVVVAALLARRMPVAVAAPAAALLALVVLLLGTPDATPYPPVLTTDHHDVWSRVRDVVPRDGLVFTSLTGPVVTIDQGWNYYAPVSGRQLYLAGWSNSKLLVDEDERARRLAANAAVLGGLAPDQLRLSRRYPSAFAVIRAGERPPPRWTRIYANDSFVLYRIPR
jgi:hypothetical protein